MINFQNKDINFTLKNKTVLKQWIKYVIAKNKHKTGDISFVFCSVDYLLNINKQYLNHNTYTDIITFDYSKERNQSPGLNGPKKINGDILICIEQVKENAAIYSTPFENELYRVMIHGILHLLGYTDKTKISKKEMTKQEDLCLNILKNKTL